MRVGHECGYRGSKRLSVGQHGMQGCVHLVEATRRSAARVIHNALRLLEATKADDARKHGCIVGMRVSARAGRCLHDMYAKGFATCREAAHHSGVLCKLQQPARPASSPRRSQNERLHRHGLWSGLHAPGCQQAAGCHQHECSFARHDGQPISKITQVTMPQRLPDGLGK